MQSHDHDTQMSYLIDLYEEHLNNAIDKLSDNTIQDRIRCLRRVHLDLPHGWVFATRRQLETWLRGPKPQPPKTSGWSPSTKATYRSHLEAGYAWLVEIGQRPDNPVIGIPRAPVPVHVRPSADDEQTRIALTHAPEPLRIAVMLANYQGLRRAEACHLDREHVTEDLTYVLGKGGAVVAVPTHPAVWECVRDRPPGPLIVDRHGRRMKPNALGVLAYEWFRRHLGPGIGLHYWRRRFGRWLRRHGDIELARAGLRHKKIETTAAHYAPAESEEVRTAVLAIPVVPGPSRLLPGSDPAPAPTA